MSFFVNIFSYLANYSYTIWLLMVSFQVQDGFTTYLPHICSVHFDRESIFSYCEAYIPAVSNSRYFFQRRRNNSIGNFGFLRFNGGFEYLVSFCNQAE